MQIRQVTEQRLLPLVPCPHGTVKVDFSETAGGFKKKGDQLTDLIKIDDENVWGGADCYGPAIYNAANAAGVANFPESSPLLSSGDNLLIFTKRYLVNNNAFIPFNIAPCIQSGDQRPRVLLQFKTAVDIVGFTLIGQNASADNLRTRYRWFTPGPVSSGWRNSIKGDGSDLYVDISRMTPAAKQVQQFELRFGEVPGLQSFTICKEGAEADGDPHIHTIDQHHYSFLGQGSFLLWRFSGLHTLSSKTSPEWRLYAHYSGHASYTKGLLLLDASTPKTRALELTALDCQWRREGEGQWITMDHPGVEGTDVTNLEVAWNESRDYHNVKLIMNSQHGAQHLATLHISCRPNHNINTRIVMERPGDSQYVQGQVGMTSKRHSSLISDSPGMSTLQTAQDQEFMSNQSWTALGGSPFGETYLSSMDEHGVSLLHRTCTQESDAVQICTKHLGNPQGYEMDFFHDCVYDVCTGGGEVTAELMALIRHAA